MNHQPEQHGHPQDKQPEQAPAPHLGAPPVQPREESALPVGPSAPASRLADSALKRRTTLRVVGGTLVFVVVMSVALEYAGWEIAFRTMPEPHARIAPLSFLRGVWDTTLGAVGIGTGAALAALLFPTSWRESWRRVPATFALGAGSFIAFLSFVTFGFFG